MSRNFIEPEKLEEFKKYFIQTLPRLFELRKEISSNLINLSKSSDIKNHLHKHIQKCSNLEKEERPLEDYISKITRGYNQLLTIVKRTNQYINCLSKCSDRCKNPKISIDIQPIHIPSRENLKGYQFKSMVKKGSTLSELSNKNATPINKLAARTVGIHSKKK